MKCLSYTRNPLSCLLLLFFTVLVLLQATRGYAAADEFFPVLQIGTHTYRNVTVTTRAKDYVFILHSGGMGNLKVKDLPPDVREKLGYAAPTSAKSTLSNVGSWARKSTAGQAWQRRLNQGMVPNWSQQQMQSFFSPRFLVAALGIFALLYISYCYCAMLICEKTGNPPGVLVWLPVVQLIPMLRAARMSPLWFIALLVPVVNLVAHLVWCFKIVQARRKSSWVAVGLLLPITNIFAFLYLAFSDAAKPEKQTLRPEIMTLETA